MPAPTPFNGSLLPWIQPQFFTELGVPVAGGKLYSYTTRTTDGQDTFSQADLDPMSANTNPLILDAGGYLQVPVYLSPIGYTFLLTDADDVELWSVDDVEDVGQVFQNGWGQLLGDPTTYTNGETIPETERYARINSSSGSTTVYLSAASAMTQPLTIKNMGSNAVTVTADGTDTIEGSLSSITIPAAATPTFPSVFLASDGVSDTSILASHGM